MRKPGAQRSDGGRGWRATAISDGRPWLAETMVADTREQGTVVLRGPTLSGRPAPMDRWARQVTALAEIEATP